MAKTFTADVNAWIQKSEKRMEAVFKTAVQSVANETNRPIPKGGRLPVDTSFLRNSFSGAIGRPPTGPSKQGEGQGNPDDVFLVIAKAKIGETIYLGWSAEYARYMEARYGFRDAAAQNWQKHVRSAVSEAQRRFR